MNPVQRVLRKLLNVQVSFPRVILSVASVLALFSVFYTAGNLGFLTSQKQLISPSHPLIQLSEQLDQFEDFDTFVVAVENREASRSLKFLKTLVPLLEADRKHYSDIFFRIDPDLFKPWALLYLDKKDLLDLQESVIEHRSFIRNIAQSPGLTNFFKQIHHEMTSRMVGEIFTGFLDEKPGGGEQGTVDLDFLIRVLRKMREWLEGDSSLAFPWSSLLAKSSWRETSEEGYFWTENDHYLLLFVTPQETGEGFVNGGESLKALREAIARVQAHFPEIRVGVTGPEALNEDEMQVAFRDMSIATFLSLLGLTILLFLFWRGMRMALLEMIQLLIALSLTFGLTTLLIGHLNLLSVSFAPMLLGLGIDYGIHWISRYREIHGANGLPEKEALQSTMVRLGPGILLAGLSAAFSFLPLVLTGFKGLVELGIICSVGLIVATMTTLCLLPALILVFDKSPERRLPGSPSPPIRPLFKLTRKRAFVVLAVAGIAFVLSSWGAGRIRFDLNMLHLQSKKSESVRWEKKLIEDSSRPSMYGAVFTRSLQEVARKTTTLERLPSVSKVESVVNVLPSDQEEKLDLLRKMRPALLGAGTVQNSKGRVNLQELREILGKIRSRMTESAWEVDPPLKAQMTQVRNLIDDLGRHFQSMEQPRLTHGLWTFQEAFMGDLKDKLNLLRANTESRPMKVEDLPKSLLQRFVGRDGLYLIRVFPARDIWKTEVLEGFVRDLTGVEPDAVGDPVTLYVFTRAFRDACIKASFYAAAFIFGLLLLTFRSIVSALLAMIPLIVGTTWTFGLMSLLGVNLNLANGIFLPLVVGAGVEYGIIIVQRWRQRKSQSTPVLPLSTGQGVLLAGLTTTVGFGSLILSDHQGLHSLGVLTFVGSLVILAAAIFVLPALLRLLTKSEEERP